MRMAVLVGLLGVLVLGAGAETLRVTKTGTRVDVPLGYVAEWFGYTVESAPKQGTLALRQGGKTLNVTKAQQAADTVERDGVLYASGTLVTQLLGVAIHDSLLVIGPGNFGLRVLQLSRDGAPTLNLPLSRGADEFTTSLHIDAWNNRLDLAQTHLGGGVDAADSDGRTALHIAAWMNHTELVAWLLAQGARLDAVDAQQATPLTRALLAGKEDMALLLLERGASAAKGDLVYAARAGLPRATAALLQRGLAVNSAVPRVGTALSVAAGKGHLEIVQRLVEQGADVNAHARMVPGALLEACTEGHLEVARYLLEHGAEIEPARCGLGPKTITSMKDPIELGYVLRELSPLQAAVYYGHLEVTRLLLEHGADPAKPNADGLNALYLAVLRVQADDVEMVRLLTAHGLTARLPDPAPAFTMVFTRGDDMETFSRLTPLHLAVLAGYPPTQLPVVTELLAHGADVQAADTKGHTALHFFAMSRGDLAVGRYLLEQGADRYAKSQALQTPYDLSVRYQDGDWQVLLRLER